MINGAEVGKKHGIQAALEELHDPNAGVPGVITGEQAALFPVKKMEEEDDARDISVKKAGRPLGSKNRSTEEWRNFLFSRYRSPLIGLAEIAAMDLMALAKMMRFETDTRHAKPEELLELTKVQIACRDKLAPYLHGKMPLAIEGGAAGLINLTIGAMGSAASEVAKDDVFRVDFIENETAENSGLQSDENQNSVVSNSVVSDETAENSGIDDAKATDTVSVGNDGGL